MVFCSIVPSHPERLAAERWAEQGHSELGKKSYFLLVVFTHIYILRQH